MFGEKRKVFNSAAARLEGFDESAQLISNAKQIEKEKDRAVNGAAVAETPFALSSAWVVVERKYSTRWSPAAGMDPRQFFVRYLRTGLICVKTTAMEKNSAGLKPIKQKNNKWGKSQQRKSAQEIIKRKKKKKKRGK